MQPQGVLTGVCSRTFSPPKRNVNLLIEFWGAVMSDYQAYATENPEELARAIEDGIPHTLRGMVWQMMAASKDPATEKLYLKIGRAHV